MENAITMATLFTGLSDVVTAVWSVITQVCTTIVQTPILLAGFLLMIVSFGVGLTGRIKNRIAG